MTKSVEIARLELLDKITKGRSVKECAQYFDCSSVTIRKYLKIYGIALPQPKDHSKRVKALFESGLSRGEIADTLGITLGQTRTYLKKLGLKYTKGSLSEIQSRALKASYAHGKSKPRSFDHYPDSAREKIREWNLTHAQSQKDKREKACLAKYGVKNVFSLPETKQKIVQTNLKRYGATSAMKNSIIANKTSKALKRTLAKKYNHQERTKQLELEYKKKGRQLTPKEVQDLWGISESNTYLYIRKHRLEDYVMLKISELEEEIKIFLDEHGVKYIQHDRQCICPMEIDFYIPEFNVAIEVNDIYSHNSTFNAFGGKPKPKDYHYKKSIACERKGIRLIHIWEYEWYDKRQQQILKSIILSACNQAKTIYARKCSVEVRPSVGMRDFFDKNNMAGFRGGKFAICLVYEDEVVMAYMMGHAFFGKGKYEWEVIRGATKLGYRVIGGASRIWTYFMKNYNPESVVYYIDFNYFDGNSLKNLGLQYAKTQPGFKNYFRDSRTVKNRQPAKHKEIKELIAQNRVWEVWNAGTKVYIWTK